MSGATGTKQWCINLLNSTRNAFLIELRQIAEKHDDAYIKELINENGVSTTQQSVQPVNQPKPEQQNENKTDGSNVSLILGIIGAIFAWIFAIIGHALCIVGIVLGVKEYKQSGKSVGLVVSIIGEVCAVISSLIGIAMTM